MSDQFVTVKGSEEGLLGLFRKEAVEAIVRKPQEKEVILYLRNGSTCTLHLPAGAPQALLVSLAETLESQASPHPKAPFHPMKRSL